ncbi:MAG: SDR family NAD(P)-dependent oxidoreductase [Betaproteobacteria bacterium]|jgi:dehydrogenase/reductase SDR family protein 12|nr:SDR family NAD(P)-dependent oxidoreductase [Betaproteobacteria bacterium]
MIRLRETVEVARPIDDVFSYVSNFGNAAQWDPGVAESRKASRGPIGVGSAFELRVRFGPRSIPMAYTIREFDRPRRVLLEGKSDSVHALDDIAFAATPRGTRITYTADISLLGALSVVEPLLKGALDRVGKKAVAGLQSALSGGSSPPGRSRLADLQDRLIVPGLVGFTKVGYHCHKRNWKPLAVSLRGRTVVVTGATSGLGQAAALQLAELGARVILVGRNPEKAEATRREIVATTGNDDVAVALADLSLLADVRKLAQRLLEDEPRIHVLVNNAGVLLNQRTTTAEGHETALATNLLAPYLLTRMLLPRLRESAPSRIINVSSGGMYATGLALDDLQYEKTAYDGSRAYARTKRALVTLSEMWAEQLQDSGVVVHAMHPGWADTPGVAGSLPAFHRITRHFLRTAGEGADTITWLAAAPEAAKVTGMFWLDREPHTTHVFPGTDPSPQERQALWDALARLTSKETQP